VHGGGKEIDAHWPRRASRSGRVDGLRVTDAATLDVVVSVLAGAINTPSGGGRTPPAAAPSD
jgi:acetylglutamate kinase